MCHKSRSGIAERRSNKPYGRLGGTGIRGAAPLLAEGGAGTREKKVS